MLKTNFAFITKYLLITFVLMPYLNLIAEDTLQLNKWTELKNTTPGDRTSFALIYNANEKQFLCLGGAKQDKDSPYSEMTFSLNDKFWKNRFPNDKLGIWGGITGPTNTPKFAYGQSFIDVEGMIRPNLSYGYMRSMALYHNTAHIPSQNKIIIYWHLSGLLTEYDLIKNTWSILLNKNDMDPKLCDDLLWGSLCYDAHNNEILGGQGRWIYRISENKWHKLNLENAFLSPLKNKASEMTTKVKLLKAALRNRFYIAESASESKVDLNLSLKIIREDYNALREMLTNQSALAKEGTEPCLWALELLTKLNQIMPEQISNDNKCIEKMDRIHDLAELIVNNLEWVPPKRANSPLVYDPENQKILMFGGDTQDRLIADTWSYNTHTRTWSQCHPKISPAPSSNHALCYSRKSKKVIYISISTNQCWSYDVIKNKWVAIQISGDSESLGVGWHPGNAAINEDDVVLKVCVQNKKEPISLIAKIDPSAADDELTKKNGVAPNSQTIRIIYKDQKSQPHWFEQIAGDLQPDAESNSLNNLPLNTWVKREVPEFSKGVNRAWSTAVFDPDREVILHWGGGHSAHCGNNILMYSTRSNRYFTGTRPEYSLEWGTSYGSNLCPPISFTYKSGPFVSHQRSYAFDQTTGRLFTPNYSGKIFIFDPKNLDWTQHIDNPFHATSAGDIGAIAMCSYTNGVAAYLHNKLFLLDTIKLEWLACSTAIKLPSSGTDRQSIVFDSNRNRLLLFSSTLNGNVISYDLNNRATKLITTNWKTEKPTPMREAVYVKHLDCVFTYNTIKMGEQQHAWAVFDCQTESWFRFPLFGTSSFGVSTGLVYDPVKELLWMLDAWSQVYVLRTNLNKENRLPMN